MKKYIKDEVSAYYFSGIVQTRDGRMVFLVPEGQTILNEKVLEILNDPRYQMAIDRSGRALGISVTEAEAKNKSQKPRK